jgi:hypothetical protein
MGMEVVSGESPRPVVGMLSGEMDVVFLLAEVGAPESVEVDTLGPSTAAEADDRTDGAVFLTDEAAAAWVLPTRCRVLAPLITRANTNTHAHARTHTHTRTHTHAHTREHQEPR